MILVTLGTVKYKFTRPLIEIDKYIKENNITEKVILQNGFTEFKSEFMDIKSFLKPSEMNALYDKARIIISHGGTGSVVKACKMKKKVIVVPRLQKYGEHIDDHQLDLVNEFDKMKYILSWTENKCLDNLMNDINSFHPIPYLSKNIQIINYLEHYIDNI